MTMNSRDQRRSWICCVIATVVIGWAVFAFGSPQDIIKEGDVIITEDDILFEADEVFPVRTMAAWATGIGALLCLFLLPGRRSLRNFPVILGIAAGVLLLFGWFMVANASHDHDSKTWQFVRLEGPLFSWAPGSIVRSRSIGVMIELTLVLLALVAAVRASEGSAWRGLFALLALLGAAVALLGLFHKAAAAPTVYWIEDVSQPAQTFFAPYVYNANAGAFMNLCLPLAMGLALSGVGVERKRAAGIVWSLVAAIIIAGIVVAASKGAIIVLLLTLPIILIWNHRRLRVLIDGFFVQRGRKMERLLIMGALAVLILSFVAIGISFVIVRWNEFFGRFEDPSSTDLTGRYEIIKLMIRMSGWEEGGWHGFGPGTFRHLVPYFNTEVGTEIDGVWLHGHCDPLQTTVEWGWLGAAAWLVIGGGAVVSGLLLLRTKGLLASADVPLVRGAVVALAMVGLHSVQDFPLSIYSIHLSAMLLCGVCWGLHASRRREARKRKANS